MERDNMKVKCITNRGKVRKTNEDAGGTFYNKANQLLAIVADGMGGHLAGEIASKLAVTHAKNRWEQHPEMTTAQEAEFFLGRLMEEMNEIVFTESLKDVRYGGMGTTVVLTISTNQFATIGHVGDSRCYVRNEEGFKQLTVDHSYVNELVRTGEISPNDAENHPNKNVLVEVIGTDETVKYAVKTIGLEQGDVLLLCSDGLYEKVSVKELHETIDNKIEFVNKWQALVDLANDRGGEDNITLVAVLHDEAEKVGGSSC